MPLDGSGSKEAFRLAKVAGGADVGEREVELVGAFVTYRTQFILAIFDGKTAAVPVVVGLCGKILNAGQLEVQIRIPGQRETRRGPRAARSSPAV